MSVCTLQAVLSKSMGPARVLETVYNRNKCVKLAEFYVRWAEVIEATGNEEATRDIFYKAISHGAEPIEKIHTAVEFVVD